MLDTTPQSVNSAMQRARKTLDEHAPESSQQESLRALGDDELRELVERYADAWERGDVDTIVEMLADDVLVTMPPMATWFDGREAAAYFLREVAFAHRWDDERFVEGERRVRLVPARAAAQPALASYRWARRRARTCRWPSRCSGCATAGSARSTASSSRRTSRSTGCPSGSSRP